MAVSPGYQTFVLDQLRRVLSGLRAKRMFGGVGLYAGELFFALLDDDTLYLKVDDQTRPEFERRGLEAWRPFGEEKASMQYYQFPEDLLEDPEAARPWAEAAVAVARRAKAKRTGKAKVTRKATTKATTKAATKATTKATKGKAGAKAKRAGKSRGKPRR